jgi:hypothetical protein
VVEDDLLAMGVAPAPVAPVASAAIAAPAAALEVRSEDVQAAVEELEDHQIEEVTGTGHRAVVAEPGPELAWPAGEGPIESAPSWSHLDDVAGEAVTGYPPRMPADATEGASPAAFEEGLAGDDRVTGEPYEPGLADDGRATEEPYAQGFAAPRAPEMSAFSDAPEVSAEFAAAEEFAPEPTTLPPSAPAVEPRSSMPPPYPRPSMPPAPPPTFSPPATPESPVDALDELSAADAEEVAVEDIADDDAPSLDDLAALTTMPAPRSPVVSLPPDVPGGSRRR